MASTLVYFLVYDQTSGKVTSIGQCGPNDRRPPNSVVVTKEIADQCGYWSTVSKDGTVTSGSSPIQTSQGPTTASAQLALQNVLADHLKMGVEFKAASSETSHLFGTDDSYQTKYGSLIIQVSAGLITASQTVISLDGTPVVLTVDEIKALAKKASDYYQACQTNYGALFNDITSNVNTDTSVGWPSIQ